MTNLPTATYRLQLNSIFTFEDAIAILEYLSNLNISDIYISPYFQAVGSMQGYDVADFLKVSNELGGEPERVKFCIALKNYRLGQVIDMVPNHMGAKAPENTWWTNVLKYGLDSPYAKYFDIYWEETPKILLSVLGADFDQVVNENKLRLHFANGKITFQYYEQTYPISPFSLTSLFSQIATITHSRLLTQMVKRLNKLPSRKYCELAEKLEQQIIEQIQKSEPTRQVFYRTIAEYNNSPSLLKKLHQEQNYQLVYWQTSLETTSYRRFFHLNSLIALRMEDRKVFTATHKLVLQWFKDGVINGVRVDHIDGLRNPFQYLTRLNKILPETWIVVEKILSSNESIPGEWKVFGTTGYEFLAAVTNILIDSSSENAFSELYAKFIGEKTNYSSVLREKKILVLQQLLAADLNFLTEILFRICQRYRPRKFSRSQLRKALQTIIACFPRYRTYIEPEKRKIRAEDKKIIINTIIDAKKFAPEIDYKLFDFIGNILFLKYSGELTCDFISRFQQITSPAIAKGGEDTALYCYNRFVALNEVGVDPGRFGISIEDFHQVMLTANRYHPYSMLTTSTHDTKRSEDVRARLVLLSEIAAQWFAAVNEWAAYNQKYHATNLPDYHTQYFLYQNLVGVWPFDKERFIAYMIKAVREAEIHTSWFFPNLDYEKKLADFITELFSDLQFCTLFEKFVNPLINPGRINSLSQVVIKLTAPGIPDIYQGAEIWNFSLVDPDNRLPVDFQLRSKLFQEMLTLSVTEILQRMNDGLPKLWVTYRILGLRKKYPKLFNHTAYSPLLLEGEKKQHGIAFLRGKKILVIVPRLPLTLNGDWHQTSLDIPEGKWQNILTNEDLSGGKTMVASLLQNFPVAVLIRRLKRCDQYGA